MRFSRYAVLHMIQRLDPERDHQRIVFLSSCHDFPFDTTRSLEFALFRTFCVPSVSMLLDRTGEFRQRSQKRYDDTDIIVSELMEWGYDSDRGKRALRRMNQLDASLLPMKIFCMCCLHSSTNRYGGTSASAGVRCVNKNGWAIFSFGVKWAGA